MLMSEADDADSEGWATRTVALAADPRLEAAAREWCRMEGMDADGLVSAWPVRGRYPRWQRYLRKVSWIVGAADAASAHKP
jgi:hypothetical protein